MWRPISILFLSGCLTLTFSGCRSEDSDIAAGDAPVDAAGGEHEHTAPHGGVLLELGDEFAHVELVFDPAMGRLTAYVLDGEAENSVRLEQVALTLRIDIPAFSIVLPGVENPLTGERTGDTSQFEGIAPQLVSVPSFSGILEWISVRGQEFSKIPFRYPE